jgi:hypothetical protein
VRRTHADAGRGHGDTSGKEQTGALSALVVTAAIGWAIFLVEWLSSPLAWA